MKENVKVLHGSATAPPHLLHEAPQQAEAEARQQPVQERAKGLQRRRSVKGWKILPPPRSVSKTQDKDKKVDPQTPSTWDPRLRLAYEQVAVHGTVLKEKLSQMLKAAGHRNTWNELITQVADKLAPYHALTNAGAVYEFFVQYEARINNDLRKAFDSRAGRDGDGSPVRHWEAREGVISFEQLEELVFELGYTPLPSTVGEILDEASLALQERLESVDQVTFSLFERFVEILVQQEGFSAPEIRALHLAFRRFDIDSSGAIEISEIGAILVWLGYWSESDSIRNLMTKELERMDKDILDLDDFIHLMRLHRAFEYAHIVELFERFDTDGDHALTPPETMRLFKKLGLSLRPETLFEVLEDLELNFESFNFIEFWKILELIRHREGFVSDELRDIATTFERFDRFKCGELITRKVPNALRWLGYLVGRGHSERIDWRKEYGNRGRIGEIEFVKIVRDHAESDLRSARKIFRELAAENGAGLLPVCVLETALRKFCSYFPEHYGQWVEENMPELLERNCEGLDFEEFRRVFRGCRDRVRDKLRSNRGFSDEEIARFRKHFPQKQKSTGRRGSHGQGGDSGGGSGESDGVLPPSALIELFRTLCPAVGTSTEVHGMLKKALSYHQVRRGMDWETFLLVMRTFTDLQEEEQACGAHLIRDELCVDSLQVEDYLDVFQQYFRYGPKSLSHKDLDLLYRAGRKEERLSELQTGRLQEQLCSLHEQRGAAGSVQKFVLFAKELRKIDPATLASDSPSSPKTLGSTSTHSATWSHPAGGAQSSMRGRGNPNRLLPPDEEEY